ncbi:MAG: ABC transporter permease [Bacillaceae bacterium]|nr:ABC transporter permease [Bacillaceae bacterium]
MKAYIQLTMAQLRIFMRNRQVIFFSLLFPVLLMVMLGSFVGDSGVSLSGLIVDQDESQASGQLIASLEQQGIAEVGQSADLEEALDLLEKGEHQFVLVIPDNYDETVMAWQKQGETGPVPDPASLTVYYDETNMVTSQLGLVAVRQVIDGISKNLTDYQPALVMEQKPVESLGLQYIDFLVPGIVAMMIMSNNLNGVAGQIAAWRERGILRRMQSTPLRASTFISAQITARLLLNGFQAVIVLLIGFLFFDTQVRGSWLLLLLFVILGTLTFIAMGFIIAGLARTPESAGPIAGMISFPMLFLGGVFFPISSMPSFLQAMVKTLPISHLSTALRQVMNVGADLVALWPQALVLFGWMIVSFLVASYTFKWE